MKDWVNSNDPIKFAPYALYDIPGSAWGIPTKTNTTPYVYKYDDYWDRVKANVETAYNTGFLSKDQWDFWMERYENKEHYLGLKYEADVDSIWNFYKDRNDIDTEAFTKQAVKLELPGKSFYEGK